MKAGNSVGCVIMASGLGVRFGSNKLLQIFQGKTLIQRVLEITDDVFDKRVVVTRSPEIKELCERQNVAVIFHSLPYRNDTVRLGMDVMKEMEGVMFCPSDQPMLRTDSIRRLVESFLRTKGKIHRLGYEKRAGTPVLFGKEYFEELAALPEKCGGSYLVNKYPECVEKINATEEIELFDIDTMEDYQWLLQHYGKGEASCIQ